MTPEVRVSRVTRVVDIIVHRCKKYCSLMILDGAEKTLDAIILFGMKVQ